MTALLNRLALTICLAGLTTTFLSKAWGQKPKVTTQEVDGTTFRLPEGMRVERVADEPLVKWPIVADWDQNGQLVVAESGGVQRPVIDHNKRGLHKIVRLSDSDGDGKFDRRLVAVDGIGFPEGVLCLGNSILVSIPPEIWKFTDQDADGVCEQREIWFNGQTITGCANDLHGPYFGRDGWIYWCKGAFAEQTHDLTDGTRLKSSAAHLYRKQENGKQIEVVMTGGMDNPVEMAFIREGEKFFTSTFLQHPNNGLRDGIAHAVYGGLFGKTNRVIEGHTKTGPLMPIMTQLGPAAPSGLINLEKSHLVENLNKSETTQDYLCAALFNLHQVTAHGLVRNGASYSTLDYELLSTDRVDFHPTDVIEDADGSLLVLDTGGWYDLCCPTSRVDQKTASGGIYRITNQRTKAERKQLKANAEKVTSPDFIRDLLDSRPWVRRETMRNMGTEDRLRIKTLKDFINSASSPLSDRISCIWALCSIGSPNALGVVDSLLTSNSPEILKVSCHVLALHRHRNSLTRLETLLGHNRPAVRRAAAEAIGRLGNAKSIPALLAAINDTEEDRFLSHSLIHSMIEISKREGDEKIPSQVANPRQYAAIILLATQTGRGNELDTKELFNAAVSQDENLSQIAIEAINQKNKFSNEMMTEVEKLWDQLRVSDNPSKVITQVIANKKESQEIQNLVLSWYRDASDSALNQQNLLATHLTDFAPFPLTDAWSSKIARWLEVAPKTICLSLAESLAATNFSGSTTPDLERVIRKMAVGTQSNLEKLTFLKSLPQNSLLGNEETEQQVITCLIGENPHLSKVASQVLRRGKISKDAASQLAGLVTQCKPENIGVAIETIAKSGDESTSDTLLKNLRELKVARTLPRGFLVNTYRRSSAEIQELADEIGRSLESPSQDVEKIVADRLSRLGEGDPVRGLQLFRSSKLACSGCHRMGYRGTEIGPDLTRIGNTRTAPAILEAILFPSSRIEQGYESSKILTHDGLILNGIIASENSDEVTLRLDAQRLETMRRINIEKLERSEVSLMPKGLADLMSDQDIADLLALLLTAK